MGPETWDNFVKLPHDATLTMVQVIDALFLDQFTKIQVLNLLMDILAPCTRKLLISIVISFTRSLLLSLLSFALCTSQCL